MMMERRGEEKGRGRKSDKKEFMWLIGRVTEGGIEC